MFQAACILCAAATLTVCGGAQTCAGLHEMAGHSDTQCKTEIRRDLSDSFLRDECFIQPIICFEKITGTILIPSLSFRFDTRPSFRLRYPLPKTDNKKQIEITVKTVKLHKQWPNKTKISVLTFASVCCKAALQSAMCKQFGIRQK